MAEKRHPDLATFYFGQSWVGEPISEPLCLSISEEESVVRETVLCSLL